MKINREITSFFSAAPKKNNNNDNKRPAQASSSSDVPPKKKRRICRPEKIDLEAIFNEPAEEDIFLSEKEEKEMYRVFSTVKDLARKRKEHLTIHEVRLAIQSITRALEFRDKVLEKKKIDDFDAADALLDDMERLYGRVDAAIQDACLGDELHPDELKTKEELSEFLDAGDRDSDQDWSPEQDSDEETDDPFWDVIENEPEEPGEEEPDVRTTVPWDHPQWEKAADKEAQEDESLGSDWESDDSE